MNSSAQSLLHPQVSRSSLSDFLQGLAREPLIQPELAGVLKAAVDMLRAESDVASPFLTVLLRTQGKRIETFKDALLCLSAQTFGDFEVLVLAHDVEPEGLAEIGHVVANQVESFRTRIRIIPVEGGSRAVPLNVGLEESAGRYISVFDDDDLLFANWVESFHEASERSPGRLLRSVVATQQVHPEKWADGADGFRTSTWPTAEYAKKFDQFDHLVVNHSPFMGWAFPRELFHVLGVRFDETLDVCEDWDVIVRGSLLMGVDDVPYLTAIYRRWVGGVSSYNQHSSAEWRSSEARVIDKVNSLPMLLPAGTMMQVRTWLEFGKPEDMINQLRDIHHSKGWQALQIARARMAPARKIVGRVARLMGRR